MMLNDYNDIREKALSHLAEQRNSYVKKYPVAMAMKDFDQVSKLKNMIRMCEVGILNIEKMNVEQLQNIINDSISKAIGFGEDEAEPTDDEDEDDEEEINPNEPQFGPN
jgi:hypothetical protein